jgi:transposase-like protein
MAVGWYLRFSLSYRDVEELLAERGLSVDHVTIWRWLRRVWPSITGVFLLSPVPLESPDARLRVGSSS